MSLIRIKIIDKKDGKTSFSILFQDERLRGIKGNPECFVSSSGMIFNLDDFPDFMLSSRVIYLRGYSKIRDSDETFLRFTSKENRDCFIKDLRKGLFELLEHKGLL